MVVSSLWEFPDPLLQEIIITNFRKFFSFLLLVLVFVWRLDIGGKREKGKEKRRRKKRRTKRHEKVFLINDQSPFFFCVLLPHFTISRAPFSFLFSIKENKSERVHRKTARARTHTHSHAHAPHALSQKPPFHFLWKSSSHPSVRLNANEIFLSVFVLFCVCVCVVLLPLSLLLCHERKGREMDRKKRGHSAPSSFSSLCRTLRLLTLSLVYMCMNIQVSTHSQTKPTC